MDYLSIAQACGPVLLVKLGVLSLESLKVELNTNIERWRSVDQFWASETVDSSRQKEIFHAMSHDDPVRDGGSSHG
jgi:hypothetical protein